MNNTVAYFPPSNINRRLNPLKFQVKMGREKAGGLTYSSNSCTIYPRNSCLRQYGPSILVTCYSLSYPECFKRCLWVNLRRLTIFLLPGSDSLRDWTDSLPSLWKSVPVRGVWVKTAAQPAGVLPAGSFTYISFAGKVRASTLWKQRTIS